MSYIVNIVKDWTAFDGAVDPLESAGFCTAQELK